MIEPTVGRIVWFWPDNCDKPDQPWAAIVTYVHAPRNVNLHVFCPDGGSWDQKHVYLYQGDDANEQRPQERFCEWMPYQKGQAAKTEALEKQQKEWTAPELKKAAVDELTSFFDGEHDPS